MRDQQTQQKARIPPAHNWQHNQPPQGASNGISPRISGLRTSCNTARITTKAVNQETIHNIVRRKTTEGCHKPAQIKVISWNIKSTTGRRHKAEEIINRYGANVVLLQEPHLGLNNDFKIPGFVTYRDETNQEKRETAILIRDNIQHWKVQTPREMLI